MREGKKILKHRIANRSALSLCGCSLAICRLGRRCLRVVAVVTWIVAGGLAYTVGTLFYLLGKRYGWSHAVWHLFVIAGTACHFVAALALLAVTPCDPCAPAHDGQAIGAAARP